MKQFKIHLTACALLLTGLLNAQPLTTSPEKPLPGETITLTYDPAGTPLEGQSAIEVVAYLFEKNTPDAVDVEMALADGIFTGQLATTPDTKAVGLSIKSADGKIADPQNERGYKILCYNTDRQKPVQGAWYCKALLYIQYNRFINIEANKEKAFNLIKREFSTYPSSKSDTDCFFYYASLAKALSNEEAIVEAKEKMEKIAKENKITDENRLSLAAKMARLFGNNKLKEQLESKILSEFPNGKAAQKEMVAQFRKAQDPDEQIQLMNSFKKQFGNKEDAQSSLDRMAGSIAGKYAEKKDWKNCEKYLSMMVNTTEKAGTLNNIAWNLSGESTNADAPDAKTGKAFSKQSLELVREEMETLANRPPYYSPKKWKKNLNRTYAMYADTYALLAWHTGQFEEALTYQQTACDQNHFKNKELNERYCVYFEKINGSSKTEQLLSKLIAQGVATPAMKQQHKKLFLANNTLESAYEKYAALLEKAAFEKRRQEIIRNMMEEDAPDFDLLNLKGERISLRSLKGKVVVVDFWATWCGPCKASFPAMQAAVNKYKNNDKVVFVFINTWEDPETQKKKAADFITSNNYTFNVLLDESNKAVDAYKVSGIPTKFIIDKNGKIRFKSVGFGGNDDELITELDLMINIAAGNNNSLSGAP
ncbi:MAG TPA: redoxin domain-containing protein [Bacteroidetes bacterium]|nr:redoxin domain-containing protein [Bacteroidota bacterium]